MQDLKDLRRPGKVLHSIPWERERELYTQRDNKDSAHAASLLKANQDHFDEQEATKWNVDPEEYVKVSRKTYATIMHHHNHMDIIGQFLSSSSKSNIKRHVQ